MNKKGFQLANWLVVIGLGIITLLWIGGIFFIDFDSNKCSRSEYNIYTNMSGGVRIFNNCYVPTNQVITKIEKCGFLGISCRDVEPYRVNSGGSVCFKLSNGELC